MTLDQTMKFLFKLLDYHNKDEHNSRKNHNQNNIYQVSSKKFRQIRSSLFIKTCKVAVNTQREYIHTHTYIYIYI